MAQFCLYRNEGLRRKEFPFLLNVQHDLLSELGTRVVIPLCREGSTPVRAISRLTPRIPFEGKTYLLMTPQLAGLSLKDLGTEVGHLREHRDEIVAAIDLLIVGL